jgi:hypothetical protein
MTFNKLLLASSLSALVVSGGVNAGQGGHSHGDASMANRMDHSKMFMETQDIDGYTVSFHVMETNKGMNHGGSHNLMIKVEQQGIVLAGLQANSKVIYPDGTEVSRPLMAMGGMYMVGYDLKDSGKHQLMVLFKTQDGKKHFGGVHYAK